MTTLLASLPTLLTRTFGEVPERKATLAQLTEQGWPNRLQDPWRYTPLAKLSQRSLTLGIHESKPLIEPWERLAQGEKREQKLPAGLRYECLSKKVSGTAESASHPFHLLNQVFLRETHHLTVEKNTVLSEAVAIRCAGEANVAPLLQEKPQEEIHYAPIQLVIYLEENSEGTFYINTETRDPFSWCDVEITVNLAAGARCHLVRQIGGVSDTFQSLRCFSEQFANSQLTTSVLNHSDGWVRSEERVSLKEEGAQCDLRGAYLGKKAAWCEHRIDVTHHASHTKSQQNYRGLMGADSSGLFYGNIHAPQGVKHIEAHQQNKNLLLSPRANIVTQPQLVIDTDDVVCTHGATVGQLDEEAEFYLQARGLTVHEAKTLLTKAFIKAPFEKTLHAPIKTRLHDGLNQALGEMDYE